MVFGLNNVPVKARPFLPVCNSSASVYKRCWTETVQLKGQLTNGEYFSGEITFSLYVHLDQNGNIIKSIDYVDAVGFDKYGAEDPNNENYGYYPWPISVEFLSDTSMRLRFSVTVEDQNGDGRTWEFSKTYYASPAR